METTRIWFLCVLLVVVVCFSHTSAEDEGWRLMEEGDAVSEEGDGSSTGKWFVLQNSKHVVKTDAGDMRVVGGFRGKFMRSPMHVGFITMEPRSLFIPQYLDSSLILFIRQGEARVGHIYKDELVERSLKMGDIYRIEAGSVFYLINRAEEEKLHVICSIDASESLGWHTIQVKEKIKFSYFRTISRNFWSIPTDVVWQSFFVAGGTYPTSVLAGFDHSTLSTAFNVSEVELGKMLTKQHNGPIIYLPSDDSDSPNVWSKFSDMEHHQKLARMKRIVHTIAAEDIEDMEEDHHEQQAIVWSIRKLLFSVFGKVDNKIESKKPRSYNIYDRKPDFKNNYGWSTALDGSHYSPLKHDDLGLYLVNLSAGSMMAPHMNPRATEYGIVLRGSGTIQIVYPNGTLAMNAEVTEGDVFWIPRYFPFCQIASKSGPFEFFGFTTSARNNRPQFLVGANSLLHVMRGPEFGAGFGLSEDGLSEIIDAQRESVILPAAADGGPIGNVIDSLA